MGCSLQALRVVVLIKPNKNSIISSITVIIVPHHRAKFQIWAQIAPVYLNFEGDGEYIEIQNNFVDAIYELDDNLEGGNECMIVILALKKNCYKRIVKLNLISFLLYLLFDKQH